MAGASSSSSSPPSLPPAEGAAAVETARRKRILPANMRICQFLITDGILDKGRIVHSESYLNSLKSSLKVSIIIEVPPVAMLPNCLVQQKVLHPFRKQVGGSILAAKLAKERGWAINVGGGFHHCSAEKGGGFCAYADISLCIHYAFSRLNISRAMIIDLDAHQGNGHEIDFRSDRRVYILDMYNAGIYPLDYEARQYIHQKVELASGTKTEEYLERLERALQVNPEGVKLRDEMVFRFAREKNSPSLSLSNTLVSGGYMKSSARVIADSIVNLATKGLVNLGGPTL
ncbi:unnamed protein product [Spirodela intermedia]|uniref:Histone deacetylase domain-containing protein n=1 Tax=Spirodela intermedia TaxID=51605 RepID=A0A7I8IUV7_SPIIN|nr:unnamed protein product [Spirodela intermedia]CAA6660925.1 unnamed protein product [Spirodela intermedia]